MAESGNIDFSSPHKSTVLSTTNTTNITDVVELSMNRLEKMLDWLLFARENVATLNLDLYSTFKPLESLHRESNHTIQNESKITCPLHPDCEKITNLVISNLNKITDQ